MGHGDELKAFISNSTIIIDIICVQETWLFNTKKKKTTTLAITFNINGLAFFILNNISHSLMPPVGGKSNKEASGRGGDLDIIVIFILDRAKHTIY